MKVDKNLLKSEFAKKGLTQENIAEKIGITSQTLSRKINGKRDFRLAEVYSLCEILDIDNPKEIFFAKLIPNTQQKEEKTA